MREMGEADGGQRAAGVRRFAPALLSLAAAWWFWGFIEPIAHGDAIEWTAVWAPSLEAEFAFRLDGLSLVFALLVTGIGALVLLYTAEYFARHPQRDRLLITLMLFEISMLGLVTADDALTLFLFWEGTTITSFILIGFEHEKADARAKAIQALVVTGIGGVALLAALLLIGAETGSFRISDWAAQSEALKAAKGYGAIFWLVCLGAFTKSAQIPFHFWLPNAMAAPTPVSAYLHSATMVKAGVYLLARLSPTLGGTELWTWTLTLVGGATMLLASVWAMRQTDLKLALAFTTVMGLGTLTMFLGVGGEEAALAVAAFLIVHAFYKAGLFLMVGILDKKAGSREVAQLSGLGPAMPLTWLVAALAAVSMAGLPPTIGFFGKEAMYEAGLHSGAPGVLAVAAGVLANAMMIAIAGAVGLAPFRGERRSAKAEPKDGPLAMWVGPAALAFGGLFYGLSGGAFGHDLVGPMATAIAGAEVEAHFAFWHGLTLPLGLSVATVALGVLLYLRLPAIREALTTVEEGRPRGGTAKDRAGGAGDARSGAAAPGPLLGRVGSRMGHALAIAAPSRPAGAPRFEALYEALMDMVSGLARDVAEIGQSGLLTRYMRASLGTLALMVGAALAAAGVMPAPALSPSPGVMVAVVLLIAAAAALLPFTGRRLLLITALGVTGAGVSLVFALYGAIDVAITQLMVETLVVVIIAVALLKLPPISLRREAAALRARRWNAAIAAALGAVAFAAVLTVMEGEIDRGITNYYEETSATLAHGRNIVNVILVDFRALDTMGEIAVVAIAGLAALALLAARVRPLKDIEK